MFDFLSFTIFFFLLGVIVLTLWVGIKFLYSLVSAEQSSCNSSEETNKQLNENSREDSQADLYMSEENPDDDSLMFPEEFSDD
jgi:hypothetical protein